MYIMYGSPWNSWAMLMPTLASNYQPHPTPPTWAEPCFTYLYLNPNRTI